MRRSCLDLGDELIGGPQRLVPLAAPVAVVDQHAFEPAEPPRRADPLGDSLSLEPCCEAGVEVTDLLLGHCKAL